MTEGYLPRGTEAIAGTSRRIDRGLRTEREFSSRSVKEKQCSDPSLAQTATLNIELAP